MKTLDDLMVVESIPSRYRAIQWDGTTEGFESIKELIKSDQSLNKYSVSHSANTGLMHLITPFNSLWQMRMNDWLLISDDDGDTKVLTSTSDWSMQNNYLVS